MKKKIFNSYKSDSKIIPVFPIKKEIREYFWHTKRLEIMLYTREQKDKLEEKLQNMINKIL